MSSESTSDAAALTVAELQAMLDGAPFHHLIRMNIEAVDHKTNTLVVRLPFDSSLQRLPDIEQVHGGAIASVIDSAGTFAVVACIGRGAPTMNLRIDYLRPAIATDLLATARVRRAGRTVAICDIDLHDEEGRLVAVGRGTWGTGT